jgi:polyketide synthase PksN
VKSNVGHTSAAAGVASVHKALLALKHKKLAPTLNFKQPNEHFNFEDSPFYVNTELRPWETDDGARRRVAVSSFGYSGTNAHLVIEEYLQERVAASRSIPVNAENPVLFVLSARSEEQLRLSARSLMLHLGAWETIDLAEVAYTLQVGREAMDYRLAFLAHSRAEALRTLEEFANHGKAAGVTTAQVKKSKAGVAVFEEDEDARVLLQTWIEKKRLKKIAEFWVIG